VRSQGTCMAKSSHTFLPYILVKRAIHPVRSPLCPHRSHRLLSPMTECMALLTRMYGFFDCSFPLLLAIQPYILLLAISIESIGDKSLETRASWPGSRLQWTWSHTFCSYSQEQNVWLYGQEQRELDLTGSCLQGLAG